MKSQILHLRPRLNLRLMSKMARKPRAHPMRRITLPVLIRRARRNPRMRKKIQIKMVLRIRIRLHSLCCESLRLELIKYLFQKLL